MTMTNRTSHDEGPRGRTDRTPWWQILLIKVAPWAVGVAFWVYSVVRLGWDTEFALLLALFAFGIATTGHAVLEWGVLNMPTRLFIPTFLTGAFLMVMGATLGGDPDPPYTIVLFGLCVIAGTWRARELGRLKRLRQQMSSDV